MKCFYHSADFDGICSAAIINHHMRHVELIGINYGDPFPWESIRPGERVIMVDFSLQPFEDMERLNELAQLEWIDHHKSAIDEAHARGFMAVTQILEVGKAACELTWEYCSDTPIPRSVKLLGRYDVWDHENHPGALQLQYGLRTVLNTSPDLEGFWSKMFDDDDPQTSALIATGFDIHAYIKQQDRAYAEVYAFETHLDGLRCIAINRGLTNSLMFNSVYDPDLHDAMLAFSWKRDKWTVSLYATKPEIDVSDICKRMGGGGHKGAAGFQCAVLPFLCNGSEGKGA